MSVSNNCKTLASLLRGVDCKILSPIESPVEHLVTSVSSDSRTVTPGGLFVALSGTGTDGHRYLENAVNNGCTAVLCQTGRVGPDFLAGLKAVVLETPDTNKAYAAVAANFFGRPAEKLTLVGVTGTNGKTTVTYLLEHVLLRAGHGVGVIGTVNNRYALADGTKRISGTRFTTPEAMLLQQLLREMVDRGVEYVVMEVSSHALHQRRVGELFFDVVAFTNLTRDHLDYHLDMDDYFRAKTRLFAEHMKAGGAAVLPVMAGPDPAWLSTLHDVCSEGTKVVTWGESEAASVRLVEHMPSLTGTELVIETPSGRQKLSTPLVGRFNVDNILVAVGMGSALGIDEQKIFDALSVATGAPGRLERVTMGDLWPSRGPAVFVDYAHTPDALEKVLTTVAALPHRQLIGVFGCGGDRDKGKRPVMGEIAVRLCDVAIVTDDNPRTEDPDAIVEQILAGILNRAEQVKDVAWLSGRAITEQGCTVIRDRKAAINRAIRIAGPEDVVVIAGKGHEPYQLTIQGKRFFDDRMEAGNVLLSWTDELAAEAVGGTLRPGSGAGRLLGPVTTDSRMASENGLFVALRGEKHDAHDFAGQAVENGAACLTVERVPPATADSGASHILVDDTQKALGDLAAFRRRRLAKITDQVVIGITGSCGKTTVKEMIAAILARKWPEGPDNPPGCILKTKGNFNNIIGLPLSLLPLDLSHRAAVMEMGMNMPGELTRLAEIGDPDISIITNIHGAHLQGLGSIEGVARAKEELFAGTRPSGTLIINLDDPWVRSFADKYPHRKVTFAVGRADGVSPDFRASQIVQEDVGAIGFTMHHGDETAEIHLFTAGLHNVANALAAAATAATAGASLAEIAAGLADFRPTDKRMEILYPKSGYTLINDTYNANPASMAAGLRTLKQMARKSSTAIIGDMRELGDASASAHFEIGRLIAELAIDRVGVVGDFREDVRRGAITDGYPAENIRTFADKDAAVGWIKEIIAAKRIGKDDLILIKASRGLRFETIVAKLVE